MKKLVPIMVFVLAIALSTGVLASDVEDKMVVNLEIMPYITVDLVDNLDFGQIDFGDNIGFGSRTLSTDMTIKSNDDIVIMFESIGFADMNGESIPLLNKWVQYEIYTGPASSRSDIFDAGGSMKKELKWDGDSHDFTINVHFLRTDDQQIDAREKWQQIRALNYYDVLIVTVSSEL